MATRSGSSSRPSTQVAKQAPNGSGPSALMTSLSVSFDGMPRRNGSSERRNASFSQSQSRTSTKSSAPASRAHSTRSITSGKGCSTLPGSRGSSSAEKWSSRAGTAIGKPPQPRTLVNQLSPHNGMHKRSKRSPCRGYAVDCQKLTPGSGCGGGREAFPGGASGLQIRVGPPGGPWWVRLPFPSAILTRRV